MSKYWSIRNNPIIGYVSCDRCGERAVWGNAITQQFACPSHLPRGCECHTQLKKGIKVRLDKLGNMINPPDDYEYAKDSLGNIMQCQAWKFSEDGFISSIDSVEELNQSKLE